MNIEDFLKPKEEFIASPFNYTGSKFKLLPQIKNYFPKEDTLIDLFAGGGSIFINSQEYQKIIVNDYILPLILFYKFLQINPWETVIQAIYERNIKNDKDEYSKLRDRFNEKNDFIDFFILISSCQNNMMRFNKNLKFNQTFGKRTFNHNTEKKLKQYHDILFNNDKILFTSENFLNIPFEPNTFVYLDPPYIITEAGYNAYWNKTLEEKLYDYIENLNNQNIKFMLSNVAEHKGHINPYMHRIKKYNMVEIHCNYDKVSRNGKSQSKEIIVMNY
jgi:DNA adenine methylase Dam